MSYRENPPLSPGRPGRAGPFAAGFAAGRTAGRIARASKRLAALRVVEPQTGIGAAEGSRRRAHDGILRSRKYPMDTAKRSNETIEPSPLNGYH